MTREEALRELGYRNGRWAVGASGGCRVVYHYPVYCAPSEFCGIYGMFKRPVGASWIHIVIGNGVIYGSFRGVGVDEE